MDTRDRPSTTGLPWRNSYQAPPSGFLSLALPQRLTLFVLLFAVEWIPLTYLVHKDIGAGRLLQLTVAFAALFFAFAYARAKTQLQQISGELRELPIGWGFLLSHIFAFLGFLAVSLLTARASPSGAYGYFMAASFILAGFLAIGLAGFAFVPPRIAFRLIQSTGQTWAYALAAAVIARYLARVWVWDAVLLWNGALLDRTTDVTFSLVNVLLHLFLSDVVADRTTMSMGTHTFSVRILQWCSGVEGTVLMLVFSVAWLLFFRRELRFPRAFLLIPAAMMVMWLSNAVRITALILIGVGGARSVAVNGFHSEAGWIAFNCVAMGFVLTAQRVPWFNAAPPKQAPHVVTYNPSLAYLMPFLVIVAAGMISRAASGGFEWLYPLRFVAAAATLWFFRSSYKDLDWRFGWTAPVIGGVVFALWLALDSSTGVQGGKGIATGLAALPAAARIFWLATRTIAAIVTVPIAEELAFRGFLIRRLISADFHERGFKEYTYVALLISSLAFGLMHGDRWIAGTVAGLLYAAAMLRRGRIGDAVVAHATTNALLAVWVQAGGRWDLW